MVTAKAHSLYLMDGYQYLPTSEFDKQLRKLQDLKLSQRAQLTLDEKTDHHNAPLQKLPTTQRCLTRGRQNVDNEGLSVLRHNLQPIRGVDQSVAGKRQQCPAVANCSILRTRRQWDLSMYLF